MFCIQLDYLLWLDNPEIIGNFLFVQILYLLPTVTSSRNIVITTRISNGCKTDFLKCLICLLRTNSLFVWVSHTEDWLTFQQDPSEKNKKLSCKLFTANCKTFILWIFDKFSYFFLFKMRIIQGIILSFAII